MIPFPFYISVEIRCCKPKFLFSLPFLRSCLFSCSLLYVIELYLINNQVIQEYLLVVTQTIWLFVLLRLLQRKCRMCRISSLVTITVHPRYWINITWSWKLDSVNFPNFVSCQLVLLGVIIWDRGNLGLIFCTLSFNIISSDVCALKLFPVTCNKLLTPL